MSIEAKDNVFKIVQLYSPTTHLTLVCRLYSKSRRSLSWARNVLLLLKPQIQCHRYNSLELIWSLISSAHFTFLIRSSVGILSYYPSASVWAYKFLIRPTIRHLYPKLQRGYSV